MISRFQQLLDYVFSQTNKLTFSSIVIGSECDLYFGAIVPPKALRLSLFHNVGALNFGLNTFAFSGDPANFSYEDGGTMWDQYRVFCKSVAQYIRDCKPGVKVAFEATYRGLVGSSSAELKSLNQFSDVVGVSYYPIRSDFSVYDPSAVKGDFETIASLYPNRNLSFYQLGYPSSETLNSSEAKQKEFVEAVFQAWDANAAQIGMIDFTFLTDCSEKEIADQSKYYGMTQARFSEFLRTLGLRRYPNNGSDKPAFLALQREAKARGW
jgi:hypothetical protein